jgi:histidinol-phosphate/aromatic aminotransferase/cobyric acid decarboxylase-like protein
MLTEKEDIFYQKFLALKNEAGSHSPSIFKLLKEFPEVSIKVDACFLCNPYAFDLFYSELEKTDLKKYIKFYPPQNHEVAENIAKFRGLPKERILIGNGAIEIIETILGHCRNQDIVMPIPTFSSYYDYSMNDNNIIPYVLSNDNNYEIDVKKFINFIEEHSPEMVILVNPNNPTGTLVSKNDVIKIHKSLNEKQVFIVDESFIDFANEDASIEKYAIKHNNIIIIRSLSKDFGIAGLRLGYAVMSEDLIQVYMNHGFLWNSNGIAYFFTELISNKEFQMKYNKAKKDYNDARNDFYKELVDLGLDVIPSQANFFMIRTPEKPDVCFTKLLYSYGIYTRILNDKWGLEGNFLRIASKDRRENRQMLKAIKEVFIN